MDADQYSNALGPHEEGEEEDVDGSAFVQGITSGHHDHPPPDGSAYAHPDYGRADLTIDPALNGHPRAQDPQQQHHHHPGDGHQHVENHYGDQQMQRQLYTDMARTAGQFSLHTPSENLSEASPSQFASASPAPSAPKLAPAFTPTDRSLPDKQVMDETLDDAYVAFILYCNPSVPLDCDTNELRRVFRQPPKSDGKTFNVYHLLQLIEKFERKDIKTWTKLATELGVERTPDSSAQKVQQYAVRLKRWMHAMHVDAFFEYILNKPHNYYQQIPPVDSDRPPEKIRDGVAVEEDLALRALHPETRPKRGRRKTDDKDDASEKDMPPAKRPHLDTGTPASADAMDHFAYPNSAIPSSAIEMDRYLVEEGVTQDQWTAATHSVLSGGANSVSTPTGGQQFRWRAYSKMDAATTPSSAHPGSNLLASETPNTPHPHDDAVTPITATTPSSSKHPRRRRHGPAVSSAWPSSSNPLTGKLRGRPPQNRSVRDGPFSTFPANPSGKSGPTVDISHNTVTATPTPTPVVSHPPQHFSPFRPPSLHLTVPAGSGNRPIAMASPASAVDHHTNGIPSHVDWSAVTHPGKLLPLPPRAPTWEDMEQTLAVALVRAEHATQLSISEANLIAHKLFSNLRAQPPEHIAALTGNAAFEALSVQRMQSELEELGLHDPEDDAQKEAGGGERRYMLRWETTCGPLTGGVKTIVVLGSGGEGEEDGIGEFEEETAEELRKRVKELEGMVRGMQEMREKVLRAVVKGE